MEEQQQQQLKSLEPVYVVLRQTHEEVNLTKLNEALAAHESKQFVAFNAASFKGVHARESSGDEADTSRTIVSEAFLNALKAKVATELSASVAAVDASLNAEEQHKEEVSNEENDDNLDSVEERDDASRLHKTEQLSGEIPLIVEHPNNALFLILDGVVESVDDFLRLADLGVPVSALCSIGKSPDPEEPEQLNETDATYDSNVDTTTSETEVIGVEGPTNDIRSLIDEVDALSHPSLKEFSAIHLLDSFEDLTALAQTLCTRLRNRYESVCRYRIWSAAPRLPIDDGTKERNERAQNLDTYRSMLDAVPAGSVSVPAVLQAMFEQVAHTIQQEKSETIASTTPNEPDDVAPTLQTYIQQAWDGLSPPTTTEKSSEVEDEELVSALHHADRDSIGLARASLATKLDRNDYKQAAELLRRSAELRRLLPLPGIARHNMPDTPSLSPAQRGIDNTARHSATQLPAAVFQQAMNCSRFDELMSTFGAENKIDSKAAKRDWKFGSRQYREERMEEEELAQVLEDALLCSPTPTVAHTAYVPERDELALVVHTHTPHMRAHESKWSVFVPGELSYRRWDALPSTQKNFLPQKILKLSGRDVDDVGDVSRSDDSFYASDAGVFGASRLRSGTRQNVQVWMRMPTFSATLQRRQKSTNRELRLRFSDGSSIVIRGDSATSREFRVQSIGSDGAVAELCSSGHVFLHHLIEPNTVNEKSRCVFPDASVQRTLKNGDREVLHPDSSVILHHSDGSITRTTSEGCRQSDADGVESQLRPLESAVQTDPESGACVTCRQDGVTRIDYRCGKTATLFSDGTRLYRESTKESTTPSRIETPFMGVVKILHEENTAHKCSNVTVDLSGQPPLVLDVERGVITVEWSDVRVISQRASEGLRSLIVPKQNGVNVPETWATMERVAQCYMAEIDAGRLSTFDADDNFFVVDDSGAAGSAQLSMETNNVVPGEDMQDTIPKWYYPPPEKPLEPRAFIVQGDGSASELVSDAEAERALSGAHVVDLGNVEDVEQAEAPASLCLLRRLSARPRYASELQVPNIVRGGAGLASAIEEHTDATHGEFIVVRSLRKYAVLDDDTRAVAQQDLQNYQRRMQKLSDDDVEFEVVEKLDENAVDEQHEILQAVLMQQKLAIHKIAKTSDNGPPKLEEDANDVASGLHPTPPKHKPRSLLRRSRRMLSRSPTGYFDDDVTSRRFQLEVALNDVLEWQTPARDDDEAPELDERRLASLSALDEMKMCLERCLEPHESGENEEERRRNLYEVDLQLSPYKEILSSSIGLQSGVHKLLNALGLQERSPQDFLLVDDELLKHSFTQLDELVDIARERIHRHQLDVPKDEQQQQQPEEEEAEEERFDDDGGDDQEQEQEQTLMEHDDESNEGYSDVDAPEERFAGRKAMLPPLLTYAPAALAVSIDEGFAEREAAARRRLRTTSTMKSAETGSAVTPMFIGDKGDMVVAFSRLRIQPSQARFGSLCVGKSFRYGFRVTNIGYEIGRFHVGPVVIHEGNVSARVVRRTGPIAPGMAVRMELEVYARQPGRFRGYFPVQSELEMFKIPIVGRMLDVDTFSKKVSQATFTSSKSAVRIHCDGRAPGAFAADASAYTDATMESFNAKQNV